MLAQDGYPVGKRPLRRPRPIWENRIVVKNVTNRMNRNNRIEPGNAFESTGFV